MVFAALSSSAIKEATSQASDKTLFTCSHHGSYAHNKLTLIVAEQTAIDGQKNLEATLEQSFLPSLEYYDDIDGIKKKRLQRSGGNLLRFTKDDTFNFTINLSKRKNGELAAQLRIVGSKALSSAANQKVKVPSFSCIRVSYAAK